MQNSGKEYEEQETVVWDLEANNLLPQVSRLHCLAIMSVDYGLPSTRLPIHQSLDSGRGQTQDSHLMTLYEPDQMKQGLLRLQSAARIVGHNIIGYDLPAVWKVTSKWDTVPEVIDTLVISRMLWPERPWGHSLKAWGIHLGEHKGEFSEFEEYTPEMGEYCKQDVWLNYKVLKALEAEYGDTFKGNSIYR